MSQPTEPQLPQVSRRHAIPFAIPAYWTPEQALAVVELLDDLRERIWAHYDLQLLDLIQAEHQPGVIDHSVSLPDDQTF
ncbi:MAG: hypothetical protein ACREF1_07785 [Acetobacteraceae bacterium]